MIFGTMSLPPGLETGWRSRRNARKWNLDEPGMELHGRIRRGIRWLLVLAGVTATPHWQPGQGPIAFEEVAAQAGLVFRADSCPTPNKNQPETMLAGVALIDYNRDGFLDIY